MKNYWYKTISSGSVQCSPCGNRIDRRDETSSSSIPSRLPFGRLDLAVDTLENTSGHLCFVEHEDTVSVWIDRERNFKVKKLRNAKHKISANQWRRRYLIGKK